MDISLEPVPEPLMGHVDGADWALLQGWAFNPAMPDTPLWLEAVIDGGEPVRFLANMLRSDLARDGVGTGRYGFHLYLPRRLDPLVPHEIVVRRVSDGQPLPGSPKLLQRAPAAGPEMRAAFEAFIDADIEAAAGGPELAPTTDFLIRQVDRLLQTRAERENGSRDRERFRLRWADTLGGEPMEVAGTADMRPWILLIEPQLPPPAASLSLLRATQGLGHRVAVVSATLDETGVSATALRDMGVAVHGAPMYFTVEDVLKRNAGLYRCVILNGALMAAAHGVNARLHQPRARILACLPAPRDGTQDTLLTLAGLLITDSVLAPNAASAEGLARLMQGRVIHVLDPNAADEVIKKALAPALGVAMGV